MSQLPEEAAREIEDAMEELRRFVYDAKRDLVGWRDWIEAKQSANKIYDVLCANDPTVPNEYK